MIEPARARRFCIYIAVGGLGTIAHYALLMTLVGLGWLGPAPASVCGAVLGALINFILNARVTFGAAPTLSAARRFFLTAALGACANGLGMLLLADKLGLDFRIAQLLVTAIVLFMTFAINSRWSFRDPAVVIETRTDVLRNQP